MNKLISIVAVWIVAVAARAQDTNYAVRISCDFQQQAGSAELPELTLLQGSAPMIQVAPMRMGRAVPSDELTTAQLVFGPSPISTYYVATNAYLATNSAYYVQLGTIGTNSVPPGSNAPAAWWYSVLFYRNGGIYWSGSGRLYIERTTATGTNGLVWQSWAAGAAKDDIAREWIRLLSNVVENIEAGDVTSGAISNWNAAYAWGDHAAAKYMRTNGPGWQFAEENIKLTGIGESVVFDVSAGEITGNGGEYNIRLDDGDFFGPWNYADTLTVREARLLLESTLASVGSVYTSPVPAGATFTNDGDFVATAGLPRGATRVVLRTTNAYARSKGSLEFSHDGETVGTLLPTCDGAEQQLDFPFILVPTNVGIRITYREAPDLLDSAPPIITALRVWTMADTNQVGRRLDTANAIYEGDLPTYPRQWAPKQYVDAAAAAALAAANSETWTRTAPTDLAGQPLRISPRFDVVSSNDTLCVKYGGQTMLRLDGEGAMVVPEIRSFQVSAGAVATLTVWSYAGGATNLLPEVSTNLVAWTRLGPEAILSAEMTDSFTAQVVFTNASASALFVRLVDVSGGTGQPVSHFFGQLGINDDVRASWPESGTADFGTNSTQAYRGDLGHSLSGRVEILEHDAGPFVLSYGATNVTLFATNGLDQAIDATNAVTIGLAEASTGAVQRIALAVRPAASITWATSNLDATTVTLVTGAWQTVYFRSGYGTNVWTAVE